MITCYESTRALHKGSTRKGGDTLLGQVVVDGNLCRCFQNTGRNKQTPNGIQCYFKWPSNQNEILITSVKSHGRSLDLQKQAGLCQGKCHKLVSQTPGCSHSQQGAALTWARAGVRSGACVGAGTGAGCATDEVRIAPSQWA